MPSPVLVQFGAGNIGRGFIAPTFAAAGWTIIFVDVAQAMVDAFNARGSYQVIEVDTGSATLITVSGVSAIDGRNLEAVAAAVASARLVATAVGLNVIGRLGAPIAAGLERRLAANGGPLDVLVCENGVQAPALLRAAVLERLAPERRAAADAALGCVRTSIGRMIPPSVPGADLLDIKVESYNHLPVEAPAFRGTIPAVAHLEPKQDFDLVLRQKLYLHNLTHACLAYAGHLRGFATIPDCMEDADLVAACRAAGLEASTALARAHGGGDRAREAAIHAENQALIADLFQRYTNRALGDPVGRVARDPLRKLAADDRLIGAARLCVEQGVAFPSLARHILLACHYRPADDEPGAADFRRLQAAGWRQVLASVSALTDKDPIMTATAQAARLQRFKELLPHRRAAAAKAMRAAGLVLRDDEAAAIEIADFGLDRYEQYGLAIHVYVNTERCCGKELMMVPGQICPEHRHPPIAAAGGQPADLGKEETFRCRQGEVFLFLPGHHKDSGEQAKAEAFIPADKRVAHSVYKCVHLKPGEQYTLRPNTPHWFVAGPDGAVISEFSTRSRDEADVFTDTEIVRLPPA